MSTAILMVAHDAPIREVLAQMKRKGVFSAIVIEKKKPKGIIREEDLLNYLHSFFHTKGQKEFKVSAQDIMVKGIVLLPEEADFVSAFELMKKRHVSHIVIVNHKKQIVGMVTEETLLEGFARLVKHLDWKIVSAKLSVDECFERLHELGFLHE